jgi:hypothetical protein
MYISYEFLSANMATVMSVLLMALHNIEIGLEISKYKAAHVLEQKCKIKSIPNGKLFPLKVDLICERDPTTYFVTFVFVQVYKKTVDRSLCIIGLINTWK